MSSKQRGMAGAVWDFFCSLKLAIFTLITLAVTSIIGTVIEQNLTRQQYLRVFSEKTYNALNKLQFFDMYHSWWFIALLVLFCINLICCSIKRFPRVWRIVHNPVLTPDDKMLKAFSNSDEVRVKGDLASWSARMEEFLRDNFAAPRKTVTESGVYLYAEKNRFSRLGVYVTHLSILIIFTGAIIGNLFGYKGYVTIAEGDTVSKFWLRGDQIPRPLGFDLRCDDFSVSFYPGSQRPKEYRSVLTIIDDGKVTVDKRPIVVNDPLTYNGITFYQSNYGPAGDEVVQIKVKLRGEDKVDALTFSRGDVATLPNGDKVRLADFTSSYRNFGAAARVEMIPADGERQVVTIFKNFPDFDKERKGKYVFTLVDFDQRYYTGLQVTKDPGVWVVWLGCALLVLGCIVAFFVSHRRLWLVLKEDKGKVKIRLVGSSHRNQPAFALYFDSLKEKFRAACS